MCSSHRRTITSTYFGSRATSRAAARDPGFILPLPEGCRAKSGATDKLVAGLVRRGWAQAIRGRHLRQIPEGAVPWKSDDAGEPLYPVITRTGLQAIGVEEPSPELREWAERQPTRTGDLSMAEAQEPWSTRQRRRGGGARSGRGARLPPRPGCRRRAARGQQAGAADRDVAPPGGGATIAQIADATGWQKHTVRGTIAGAQKKLGLTIEATRTREVGPEKTGAKGSSTVYRISGSSPVAG